MPVIALLDTNIWVSALINPRGAPARVVQAWIDGAFQVAVSLPLLDELSDVLSRPRIAQRYGITPDDADELLQLIVEHAVLSDPQGALHECRDPDDDLVLETAILAGAQYAITRDDDLKRDPDLVLRLQAHGVTVLSVQQFLDLFA